MYQTKTTNPGDPPELNERLWQAWQHQNRVKDKAAAKKWLRVVQIVLGIIIGAAVIQNLLS